MYRCGIDVGGTNVNGALIEVTKLSDESRGVVATCTTPTTTDVTEGIKSAIDEVLTKSSIDKDKLLSVAIGTTHFVNAVLEIDARRLDKVAVVRLCGPYTRKIPPFSDFPYSLREILEGPCYYLDGGLEIDGREITPLSPVQIKQTALAIKQAGVDVVALVGVFSALDTQGQHEERCKTLMLEACPELSVVCSHTIGGPGLLERENATILNCAILRFAKHTIAGFRRAMRQLNLDCALYVTQNDGTLVQAASAAEIPVKTFASGPTNSLMGAAHLADLGKKTVADRQVFCLDFGGTSTEVCALLPSGFPRQAANFVEVGGVRTAFSMPDVYSIALGGGSRVRTDSDHGKPTIGPDSVAHRLLQDSKIFGGQILTTTDVIVASGAAVIGDASKVKDVSPSVIDQTKQEIKRMIENAIDIMKVSATPVTVILVGGGSILVTENLSGVEEMRRPPHHDCANAVGAAIAKIAGEVDVIEILAGKDEDAVLESVKQDAIQNAIDKGANPEDVHIAEVQKIGLQYVTNKATRLMVKAVGSLRVQQAVSEPRSLDGTEHSPETNGVPMELLKREILEIKKGSLARPTLGVDLRSYRPKVENGVWYISEIDVELLASGTGVLGTGGGGSSYNMALYTLDLLRKGASITVVKPESLKDDDICVFGAGYGAPSVSNERIASGKEVFDAIDAVNKVMGYSDFAGLVADEIGGGNGIVTFPSSAHYNRPVVDCDLMGRGTIAADAFDSELICQAYPTIEHGTPYLFGHPVCPCATVDGKGNIVFAMVS
jgi:N-methylhydantoinase A/oxoprolinase/acetone carboxylase beta subunit